MDRDRCVIQRLLPFTEYSDSVIRRGGVIGTLKNCTFDSENHAWLLSPEVDLLSYLLLPLAGPEEFDDEDNDKLPINLQYLPETKTRESDPDIRLDVQIGYVCMFLYFKNYCEDTSLSNNTIAVSDLCF